MKSLQLNHVLVLTLTLVTFLNLFTVSEAAGRDHGKSCNKRKECNSSAGLSCQKGICQCSNPEAQIYSETLGTCLVKVGRRCGDEDDDNVAISTANRTSCVPNAECKMLKIRKWCRCRDGFRTNGNMTSCVPLKDQGGFGESCDLESKPCEKRSGTVCRDGTCQCPFGGHQYFDEVEKRCVSYANGNCTVPKVSPCIKFAECVNVKLRTGYTTEEGVKKVHTKSVTQCHCIKGYMESKDGQCKGMAGMECKTQEHCSSEAFLTCVDGKCKCRNPLHEIVDENSGKCVSLVGSSCEKTEGSKGCVKNAECVNNRCECKNGYSATPSKTCLLTYKQICEPNQCNKIGGLACINGLCDCFDSHLLYEESANACVGLSSSSD